jgi:hypothetical protein
MALSWYAYNKPKYRTGHYRGMPITNGSIIVKFLIHLHLNSSTVWHVGTCLHFQHISATTKRTSKKLNTGLMQKVILTEIQFFLDVTLCRRVVTDVSKHRGTFSYTAKQWTIQILCSFTWLWTQYDKHLSVAKAQQYRYHDFEPACCVHIAQFCQPTVFAHAHTCRLDSHCGLSVANLICSFLISNLQHISRVIMRFIPITTSLLYKRSAK